MTLVLTINPGSASIKLGVFAAERNQISARHRESLKVQEHPQAQLEDFLRSAAIGTSEPIIAHRVVHSGPHLTSTRIIDDEVEAQIRSASIFAPLHNPQTLEWIRICKQIFGTKTRQVAVMDTSFFSDLPARASTYALPLDLRRKYGIRRLGFHGLAHRSMWRQFCEKRPEFLSGSKIITYQLGAGASIAAIKDGKPIDTSMGFTPLEGLVMATRCGDLDPGILLYLVQQGFSENSLDRLLSHQSGLLGLSEISDDFAKLVSSNTPSANLALEVYAYRAKKYLGAYLAALEGADAIIFGGGVGENVPSIREQIVDGFAFCGITLDKTRNSVVGEQSKISAEGSEVDIWVIPPDEAFELAYEGHLITQQA